MKASEIFFPDDIAFIKQQCEFWKAQRIWIEGVEWKLPGGLNYERYNKSVAAREETVN